MRPISRPISRGISVGIGGASQENPVTPIQPGPLDFSIAEVDLTEFEIDFALAGSNAIFGIVTRYTGAPVLSVTHGGEPLTLVVEARNEGAGVLSALFIGTGLTVEEETLLISVADGTIGPAVARINDEFDSDATISSGWTGSAVGSGSSTDAMIVSGSSGGVLSSLWGAAVGSSPAKPMPQAEHAVLWSNKVTGGSDEYTVPGWENPGTTGWTDDGVSYHHVGSEWGDITHSLPPGIVSPLSYRIGVEIASGAEINATFTTNDSRITQRKYSGPFFGEVTDIIESIGSTFTNLRFSARGAVSLHSFKIGDEPKTIFGTIAKGVSPVVDDDEIFYQSNYFSPYATVAAEIVYAGIAGDIPHALNLETYSAALEATGFGVGTTEWSVRSGTLPAGLHLIQDGTSEAEISGIPIDKAGRFNFVLRAENDGRVVERAVFMTVGFYDDFSDPATLSNYTAVGAVSASISDGRMLMVGSGTNGFMSRGAMTQGVMSAIIESSNDGGFMFLGSSTTGYIVAVYDGSSTTNPGITNRIRLFRRNPSGPSTEIGSFVPISFVRGTQHLIEIEFGGGQITVWWDGTMLFSRSDSVLSSGQFGPRCWLAPHVLDDFLWSPTGTEPPPALSINGSLPDGSTTSGYSSTTDITIHGAATPFSVSVIGGALPAGWSASVSGNHVSVTGSSGATPGFYTVIFRVEDSSSNTADLPVTFEVAP